MRIKTKRKIIIILIIVLVLFIIPISIFFGIKEYNNWLIKNAEIIVELNDNLEVEVFSEVKLSDFIKSINGTLIDDCNLCLKIQQSTKFLVYLTNGHIL